MSDFHTQATDEWDKLVMEVSQDMRERYPDLRKKSDKEIIDLIQARQQSKEERRGYGAELVHE